MGSHIVRVKTIGDLRKALIPFAEDCPVTTVDIKYLYENEGRVYLSASQSAEFAATTANSQSTKQRCKICGSATQKDKFTGEWVCPNWAEHNPPPTVAPSCECG